MKSSLLILYSILFLGFLVWNIVVLVQNYDMLSNQILIPAIVLLIIGLFTGMIPFFVLSLLFIYGYTNANVVFQSKTKKVKHKKTMKKKKKV